MPRAALAALVALIAMHAPAGAAGKAPTIDLEATHDTGFSNADNITSYKTLIFTGTAAPNSEVTIKNGKYTITRFKTGSAGRWSTTLAAKSDGLFKLSAVANGSASKTLYLVVDTKKPILQTLRLDKSSDFGRSNNDQITSDRTPTIVGTTDEPVAEATLEYGYRFYDSKTARLEPSNRWAIRMSGVSFSDARIRGYATDLAGNVSNTLPANIKFDFSAPGSPELLLQSSTDAPTGAVAAGKRVVVGGSIYGFGPVSSESAAKGDRFIDVEIDKGRRTAARVTGLRWQATLDPLSAGSHTLTAIATDVAGNRSQSMPLTVKVIPPTRSLALPAAVGKGVSLVKAPVSGATVAAAGDVNGDGIDDFALASGDTVYIVFGRTGGLPDTMEVKSLNGTDGVLIDGMATEDYNGNVVSPLGDINGDGVDDVGIVVQKPPWVGSYDSRGYVLYGRSGGFPRRIGADALHGSVGMTFIADRLVGVGDIDGDGNDDVAVRPLHSNQQPTSVHVLYGPISPQTAIVDLEQAPIDPSTVFRGAPGTIGAAISGRTDFNGDELDDVVLLQTVGRGDENDASIVIAYGTSKRPSTIEPLWISGRTGLRIEPFSMVTDFDVPTLTSGDINGDGRDDVAVTQCLGDVGQGLIVFGSSRPQSAPVRPTTLNGRNGFRATAEMAADPSWCGERSFELVPDATGDRRAELLVRIPRPIGYTTANWGVLYLAPGRAAGYRATESIHGWPGRPSLRLEGSEGESFAESSTVADIDGDDIGDVIVDASVPMGWRSRGAAYVLYGRRLSAQAH